MKKYLLGIAAVVVAIGFSSFTNALKKQRTHKTEDLFYWYNVNSSSRTTGGYQTYAFKSDVITEACADDDAQPICFYGSTDSTVANNTFVGSAAAENLVREKE